MEPPLFVADAHGARERAVRLVREYEEEIHALLAPLRALSPAEAHAVRANHSATSLAKAWSANAAALHTLLLTDAAPTLALPPPGAILPCAAAAAAAAYDMSYDNGEQLLAHLARDWAATGRRARRRVYGPLMRALPGHRPLRVLVPGAGACRLAWELARRGHRVEATDVSASMLVAARAIIGGGMRALPIQPHARCESGALHREACLATELLPDVRPSRAASSRLSLQLADFLEPSEGSGATWDRIVSAYFIDTIANPARTMARARALLRPGGRWLNTGPLLWHDDGAGLLRLTADELRALLECSGFSVLRWRVLGSVEYLPRSRNGWMSRSAPSHTLLFFEAKRLERAHTPGGRSFSCVDAPGDE